MTQTNNLKITLLEQSQAQKEITINQALAILDAIENKGVVDQDLTSPPGSPAAGALYIIGSSATGAWTGHDKEVAWFDQVWKFITPNEGMTLWVNDEDKLYIFDGTNWSTSASGSIGTLGGVNITGTPADNSFLTYDSGSGDWINEAPSAARTSMGLGSIATQSSSSVTITGGSVNGTPLGATTPSTGSFTNLTVSGTLTFPDDGISGNKVDGGTISNFQSTGIDDNASSSVVEVDSSNDTLSLTGQVATTIRAKRHTTSNTAGNNLTVYAGGATSGATNKDGGALILKGGTSTGTGVSSIELMTSAAGSSGTSDNTPAARVTITGDTISFSGTVSGGNIAINALTGTSYTVTATDNGKIITLNNASSITLTLPQTSTETLPQGFNIAIVQLGAGEVTVAKQGSDNLYSEGNKLKLNAQYAQATIVKAVAGSPNTWIMAGSLKI